MRRVLHPILWRIYGPSYSDLRAMEAELHGVTDIDWTIVRPPLLTDDEVAKPVRSGVDKPLSKPSKISRSDLASELLQVAADDRLARSTVTVSY